MNMNRYAILRRRRDVEEARAEKMKEAREQVAVYNKRMDEDYKMFMSESGKSRSAGIYNGTEVNHGQTL